MYHTAFLPHGSGAAVRMLLLLTSLEVWLPGQQRPDEFLRSVNGRRTKYESVLLLGMFNSPGEAAKYIGKQVVNPVTGKPFDRIIALGRAGAEFKLWEVVRVVGDNLSWSPLTDYSELAGIETDYLVAHSNGNDYGANAMKLGFIRVNKEFLALAPPAGFEAEARFLAVPRVRIFQRAGDPVTEKLGKTLLGPLMRLLQRHTDVDIGILKSGSTNGSDLFVGLKLSRPLGFTPPTVEVRKWTDKDIPFPVPNRVYFTAPQYRELIDQFPHVKPDLDRYRVPLKDQIGFYDFYLALNLLSPAQRNSLSPALASIREGPLGEHSLRTYLGGLLYDDMRAAMKGVYSAIQSGATWPVVRKEWARLGTLAKRSPEVFQFFVKEFPSAARASESPIQYFGTSDYVDKPVGKANAEADSMSWGVRDGAKILVAGTGMGASRAYERLVREKGRDRVIRDLTHRSKEDAIRYAAELGADSVLNFEHPGSAAGSGDPHSANGAALSGQSEGSQSNRGNGSGGAVAQRRAASAKAGTGQAGMLRGGVQVEIDISKADFGKRKGKKE